MPHAFSLTLAFFLGGFFGFLVASLINANRLWEDDDE